MFRFSRALVLESQKLCSDLKKFDYSFDQECRFGWESVTRSSRFSTGDPSKIHDSLESSSLKTANLRKEVEERRRLGGDSWLVTAANDLQLPNAHSTPYEPRARPKVNPSIRKESHQSGELIFLRLIQRGFGFYDEIIMTLNPPRAPEGGVAVAQDLREK